MTAPIAVRAGRRTRGLSAGAALAVDLETDAAIADCPTWPSPIYRENPVGFAREILGIEPWAKQAEILNALVPPRARVSVRAGQKVSKSNSGAIAALWFFCSFPEARVYLTAPTVRQVDGILYHEIKRLWLRAGRCKDCRKRDPWGDERCDFCKARYWIEGPPFERASAGVRGSGLRQILGFTATETVTATGTSGRSLFYIVDEASGVPDTTYDAIQGNLAGGGRTLYLANPTHTEGEFFRSHNDKREFYKTFHISSLDSPNVVAGREVIPGMAGREWVDEKREEEGEESPWYQVRVLGNFPTKTANSVIALGLVVDAEARWHETPAEGRLNVGVDVAGFGDDEAAIAAGRGRKVQKLVAHKNLSEEEIAEQVVQVVRELRHPHEQPALVKVDTTGANGLGGRVLAFLQARELEHEIEAIGINVSEKSDAPDDWPLIRDQLWWGLADWLKEGGALPEDKKLGAELVAPKYRFDAQRRRKVESKDEIKKRLKRSPDRADAVALMVYRRGAPDDDEGANNRVDDAEFDEEAEDRYGSFGRGGRSRGWGRDA